MTNKSIPYAIVALLLAFLFFRECTRETKVVRVTVPAVEGEFKPQKPVYITETDTLYITKWKDRKIYTENPVNDSLAVAYQQAMDSLSRYKLYLDAIQIRSFRNIFENDTIKITVEGEVQGELRYLKPSYLIKEREIDVEVPETKLRLLAGAEIGNNTNFSDFQYKLNVGLQNKKGGIYRLGYSRENFEDIIWVGYDFSILNFKW